MIDHVSIQCQDVARSARFYDAVLATLSGRRIMEFQNVLGYGTEFPDFWLGPTTTQGQPREVHLAFTAPDRAGVAAFHTAAVAEGAEVLHAPGLWPQYHPNYFAVFVRDPDGNNVEAVCHAAE